MYSAVQVSVYEISQDDARGRRLRERETEGRGGGRMSKKEETLMWKDLRKCLCVSVRLKIHCTLASSKAK